MLGSTTRARRRVVATIPVLALAAAGLATLGTSTANAAPSHISAPVIGDDEYYMNYVAPRAEEAFGVDQEAVAGSIKGGASAQGTEATQAAPTPMAGGRACGERLSVHGRRPRTDCSRRAEYAKSHAVAGR